MQLKLCSGTTRLTDKLDIVRMSVTSEVEFILSWKSGGLSRGNVQVLIDDNDEVSVRIPGSIDLKGTDLKSISLRTPAKVRVLPPLLLRKFNSDSALFYKNCSVFLHLEFTKTASAQDFKCMHCDYLVDFDEDDESIAEMLLQHLPSHQEFGPCLRFACNRCQPIAIVRQEVLAKHLEITHPEVIHNRQSLKQPVSTGSGSSGPESRGHSLPPYTCPICQVVLFNSEDLRTHMTEYHPSANGDSNKDSNIHNGLEVSSYDSLYSCISYVVLGLYFI